MRGSGTGGSPWCISGPHGGLLASTVTRQAPGGWRPMHGCEAPGLLSARQGEVRWHARVWQAALALVSEADRASAGPACLRPPL